MYFWSNDYSSNPHLNTSSQCSSQQSMSALQGLVFFFYKSLISPMGTVVLAETVKMGQIKMPKGVERKKPKRSLN